MKKTLLLLSLVLILGGCGINPSQKIGEEITIKGKQGETLTFGAKELPTNFPSDMPVYPGAKPSGSYAATGNEASMIVALEVAEDFNKVASYYGAELKKNGWNIKNSAAVQDGTMYSISKGERMGTVTVSKKTGGEGVEIAIVLGKKKIEGAGVE